MEEEESGPGRFTTIVILLAALAIPLGVGGVLVFNLQPRLPSGGGGGASAVTIMIPNGVANDQTLNYRPATITVVVGVNNTVRWFNQDPVPHTVTTNPGAPANFDSGTMRQGDTFSATFTSPGTYNYFCQFHPGWMKATVIVKAKS